MMIRHVTAQVASLVAVLKAARQLQLVRDLDVVNIPGFPPIPIPEHLLQQAICHSNEALLVDAMTLACVHPKTTAMPGMFALTVLEHHTGLYNCHNISCKISCKPCRDIFRLIQAILHYILCCGKITLFVEHGLLCNFA